MQIYEDKGFYRHDKLISHCKTVHKLSTKDVHDLYRKRKHDQHEELNPGFCARVLARYNKHMVEHGFSPCLTCVCTYYRIPKPSYQEPLSRHLSTTQPAFSNTAEASAHNLDDTSLPVHATQQTLSTIFP